MRAGPVLAVAAGLCVAGAAVWRGTRPDAVAGRAGPVAASAEKSPAGRAAREADDIVDAVRRGRFSAALAGIVAFLRAFSPDDLDAERRPPFDEARLEAGRWGLSDAVALAEAGDISGAEGVLARALAALAGTSGEKEGAEAAAKVRLLAEKQAAAEAAKARAEALVPVAKAADAARAKAVKDPEGALVDLLGALQVAVDPDARKVLEKEVGTLQGRIATKKDRDGLRRRADQAIQAGDYAKAREILKSLVEGTDAAAADPAEVAKDQTKLDGVRDLEENKEPEALAACRKALRWLVKQQIADGSFSIPVVGDDGKKPTDDQRKKARFRTGLTGLAALALLGHVRYDITDEFAEPLDRTLAWLLAAQAKDGSFTTSQWELYENSICTIALVDADRLVHRTEMKPAAVKALEYLQNAQDSDGGWRYKPRSAQSDMSVTGWALQALLHARMGDYEIKQNSLDLGATYIDRMTDPVTNRVGYANQGQGSYAMTAAGLFCRLRYGQGSDDDRVRLGADFVVSKLPGAGFRDSCYALFYASDGMSRLGGNYWKKWSPALKRYLLDSQVKEGDAAGAWASASDQYGKDAGPVLVACLNALSLENFFEHRE
jgi:hypothetical protein